MNVDTPFDVYSKYFGMWLTVWEVDYSTGYFMFTPADKPNSPRLRSRSRVSEFRQQRKTKNV
jgi:hypothetical protein